MTISYTLDVSQTNWKSLLSLFFRWRGSLWKAVFFQLTIWTILYLIISLIYRYVLTKDQQLYVLFYINMKCRQHSIKI